MPRQGARITPSPHQLTHPYLARCGARRGAELRIEAPGQAKKQAMLGAFDPVHRQLLVHTSPSKRSTDFVALLDHLGAAYGTATRPASGRGSRQRADPPQ